MGFLKRQNKINKDDKSFGTITRKKSTGTVKRQMRRNKVKELDQTGMKVKQIAKKLGYTVSTIQKDLHYLRTKS